MNGSGTAANSAASAPRRLVAFGPMRSGNMLLEAWVTSHPWVGHSLPADRVLQTALELGARWDEPLSQPMRRHLARLATGALAPLGQSATKLDERNCTTVDALHRAYLRVSGGDARWIYVRMHMPLEYIPAIAAIDDVRTILVMRDARDVIRSRAFRGEHLIDRRVAEWRRFAKLALELKDHPHIRVVRFESLLERPAEYAAELSKWLGERLAFPPAENVAWPDHSSFGNLPERVEPAAAFRWRSAEDEALVRYVGFTCRRELALWGYEDSQCGLASTERLRFCAREKLYAVVDGARAVRLRIGARVFPPLVGR